MGVASIGHASATPSPSPLARARHVLSEDGRLRSRFYDFSQVGERGKVREGGEEGGGVGEGERRGGQVGVTTATPSSFQLMRVFVALKSSWVSIRSL